MYGPITRQTTMFTPLAKIHPDYIKQNAAGCRNKSFFGINKPNPIHYTEAPPAEFTIVLLKRQLKHEKTLNKILERQLKKKLAPPPKNTYKRARTKRTPKWENMVDDRALIKIIYRYAQKLTKRTGERWSVDHIIPLRGNNVTGLHTFDNLQLMKHNSNMDKGNEYIIC